jgi:hypothetical protein
MNLTANGHEWTQMSATLRAGVEEELGKAVWQNSAKVRMTA